MLLDVGDYHIRDGVIMLGRGPDNTYVFNASERVAHWCTEMLGYVPDISFGETIYFDFQCDEDAMLFLLAFPKRNTHGD